VERFIDSKTFGDFVNDELLFDATVRNLQNIGEAVRCLPEETRNLQPEIEWTRIVGLRRLLVHQYFGIDEEIDWDLALNRCPELLQAAEAVLAQLPDA
jgi:uncharacterized protein with HEPN domain